MFVIMSYSTFVLAEFAQLTGVCGGMCVVGGGRVCGECSGVCTCVCVELVLQIIRECDDVHPQTARLLIIQSDLPYLLHQKPFSLFSGL